MRFIDRIRAFFYGRYRVDTLFYALWAGFFIFSLARLFSQNLIPAIVFASLEAGCAFFMFFRFFSKNIYARRRENEKFKGFFKAIKNFFVLQKNKIRDRKDFRYRTCPKCKASLRLPNKKGQHTVRCPRCQNRFEVKI